MEYIEENGRILARGLRNFDIGEILECGQCFRFENAGEHWVVAALGEVLHICQAGGGVEFWYPGKALLGEEFAARWVPYFDMERDYGAILAKICRGDSVMAAAAEFAPGIRILQQEPWEMLISFIISQNNRIPQIKKVIAAICERFGDEIGGGHAFPTPLQLLGATEGDLRECKAGFRARYIMDAADKAAAGEIPLERGNNATTEELRRCLLDVTGVGEKVAHCILLFGYGRFDSFPVDTWVQKVMQEYYFGGKAVKPAEIQKYAGAKFGEYSGFAQQYLFHYMRMKNGDKVKK